MSGELVKLEWQKLTGALAEEVASKWYETIEKRYGEEARAYHTLTHLASMFGLLERYRAQLKCPDTVAYAILFHDIVYNPKAGDNEEESVAVFKTFAKEAAIAEDSALFGGVIELILSTKTHLTDAHKSEHEFGVEDMHYFLDFDMAVLGVDAPEYDKYAEQIRHEYSFLPNATYNSLRAKILRSFLQIPNIYGTKEFREMYEAKARENVLREIKLLES